jgi:ERCC4-type nuclease
MSKYSVIRDQQEKKNYWEFPRSSVCEGTTVQKLKTGDYTLKGYEDILSIERKWSTGEFATNINEARFFRELDRLELFAHPFLILEFDYDDILSFPANSEIPKYLWPKLKVTPNYMIKKLTEIDLNYKIKIIFAGQGRGAERAEIIFKYMVQKYGR